MDSDSMEEATWEIRGQVAVVIPSDGLAWRAHIRDTMFIRNANGVAIDLALTSQETVKAPTITELQLSDFFQLQ